MPSKKTTGIFENYNGQPIISLLKNCSNELMNTRGMVMSIEVINCREHIMAWAGIGNVEGSSHRGEC